MGRARGLIVDFLNAYKEAVSPRLGLHCRYRPTCSVYMRLAVERYGVRRGVWKGLRRLVSCGPWSRRPVEDWP